MKQIFLFSLLLLLLVSGCDDDDNTISYNIPTAYDFENVNYDGQLQRLSQMAEMTTYMKTANTAGVSLDADRLAAMYANAEGAMFINPYDESKQLRSKTLSSVQSQFDAAILGIAAASTSTLPAAEGQAGVAVSNDGAKQYLLNENGIEYTQIIEKGLMGACFYYQATAVYFGDDRMNVDNITVEPGEGTEMEHHWDEAFGYLGVPRAFPTDTDGAIFWGKYCNDRDALLGTNAELMNALLKGRAAISNDDIPTRDEAIGEARTAWERVVVGTAIHYLNSGITNYDDLALRAHALSEAAAFIYDLQFNPEKRMSNAEINTLLTDIFGSTDFAQMNVYNVTVASLEAAVETLATTYNMTDVSDVL